MKVQIVLRFEDYKRHQWWKICVSVIIICNSLKKDVNENWRSIAKQLQKRAVFLSLHSDGRYMFRCPIDLFIFAFVYIVYVAVYRRLRGVPIGILPEALT